MLVTRLAGLTKSVRRGALLPGTVVLALLAGSALAPAADTRSAAGNLIYPTELVYQGAFRLPQDPAGEGWEWSNWSSALTYYPGGDPSGPSDGYPGSLFGTGHDWYQRVSEISIPVPVVSPAKDLNQLPTAGTLQAFADIRGGLFGDMEMPRVGLEYLPAQGSQTAGKLYFAWAPHLDEGATSPSHGWCNLNLSSPQSAGAWRVGNYWNYVTGDYLFAIPHEWAAAYTPGRSLATGRFRDGGQGAQGPALFAIGPWNQGNPPPPNTTLPAQPLLLYGNAYQSNPPSMNSYHHSDEWTGGAWLTAGGKSAVLFAGTKGTGSCWYGCADGTSEPPWPPDCQRGWWSTGFVAQLLFYDPADLASVVQGRMETWQPQPYATLNIDPYLYHIASTQQKYHLGATAFDRDRGLLYVIEPLVDNDRPLVHVWELQPGPSTGPTITSVRSKTSKPGSQATINGSGFSAVSSGNVVKFGRYTAAVTRARTTKLTVTIPRKCRKGNTMVTVTVAGIVSNAVQFLVK
ncbi:MAG: IPT/TIG domain-containing protein [Acidobacteriota bacterium]